MSSLFKAIQQLEQDLLRKPATLQEVLPGAQPMQTPPAKPDWCPMCGGPEPCKECYRFALESVGAPVCLTEKQVFVMSYLAARAHSFRTIEGFIDSNVMAAIHRDSERLWDMLQKGLEKE